MAVDSFVCHNAVLFHDDRLHAIVNDLFRHHLKQITILLLSNITSYYNNNTTVRKGWGMVDMVDISRIDWR